jgi:hypothetical protein
VNAVQPAEDIVREVVDEAVCALNAGAAKCVGGSRR